MSNSITTWRSQQRKHLLNLRRETAASTRIQWDKKLLQKLGQRLQSQPPQIIGLYWPIQAEPDILPLFSLLHEACHTLCLPCVIKPAAALEFRRWTPNTTMHKARYGIPEPQNTARVTPNILVVPVVGFDKNGYRIGYGGGFYDRTIAALPTSTMLIGVGYEQAKLDDTQPQQYDLPMQIIITEQAIYNAPPGNKA